MSIDELNNPSRKVKLWIAPLVVAWARGVGVEIDRRRVDDAERPEARVPLRQSLLARALRRELLAAAALLTHERIVSVNLAGKPQPGTRKIFQSVSFSLASRQVDQATTFC
jgi:hypothetical protein